MADECPCYLCGAQWPMFYLLCSKCAGVFRTEDEEDDDQQHQEE